MDDDSAATQLDPVDRFVRRPVLGDISVFRQRQAARLQPLLERGLAVLGLNLVLGFQQASFAEYRALDDAPGRGQAAIQKHGAHDRFEGIGQQALLVATARPVLALAKAQARPDPKRPGGLGQLPGLHEMRFQGSQVPFRRLWESAVQSLADDHAQRRVAEELETLVRARPARDERAMRQGQFQQRRIPERVAQAAGQSLGAIPHRNRRSSWRIP